jgi:serine/threonine-protein kinase RsbW/sigma-B regulation protein RsbU (phosphoserine phosphatase)
MFKLETTLHSNAGDLQDARDLVAALERERVLPPALVFDLYVVLDEVLSNILKYGFDDKDDEGAAHPIHVKLCASEAAVDITIEDDGREYDPFASPAPDPAVPLAERPVGGLGLHFVRSLMDGVKYQRENNRNYLILNKKISAR